MSAYNDANVPMNAACSPAQRGAVRSVCRVPVLQMRQTTQCMRLAKRRTRGNARAARQAPRDESNAKVPGNATKTPQATMCVAKRAKIARAAMPVRVDAPLCAWRQRQDTREYAAPTRRGTYTPTQNESPGNANAQRGARNGGTCHHV